jgi:hypothetical protein
MFSSQQIDTIFGNLEELLQFQSTFLQDLESRVEWDAPHRSCIGECFLAHVSLLDFYIIHYGGGAEETELLKLLEQIYVTVVEQVSTMSLTCIQQIH